MKVHGRFLNEDAVQKLQEVRDHILEEPNRLTMRNWSVRGSNNIDYIDGYNGEAYEQAYNGDYTNIVMLHPPCGTSGCIAGWLCMLNGALLQTPYAEAHIILGVAPPALSDLFYSKNWDYDLLARFTTTNIRERAKAAAEQIDRYIKSHRIHFPLD